MKDIDDMTLIDALRLYAREGYVPFHMPGHKRNPKFEYLKGMSDIDVTEIDGFDNLHAASGILKRINDRAAKVFGVRASRMLVGGSTAGILASVRALTRRGDGILIARNCHGSVFNAAEICGLDMRYVLPDMLDVGFYGSVTPAAVKDALDKSGDVKLVVVTSPTYEGVISDVASIAEVCHSFGARLLVDEAHGAHLGFATFEESARHLGADIVVNSLHKTLPSLTQTAILHICAEDIDISAVDEQLAMFETGSPSYPLMASIEGCIGYLEGVGASEWAKNVAALREELKGLKAFELYDGEGAYKFDISKLTFISRCEMSGTRLMRALSEEYGIELEMAGVNYAIAMCGAGDEAEMYSMLKEALFKLFDDEVTSKSIPNKTHFESSFPKTSQNESTLPNLSNGSERKVTTVRTPRDIGEGALTPAGALRLPPLPEKVMNACDARERDFRFVPIEEAEGRIAAENIRAYPPGCPLVVKGERIDGATLAALSSLYECGVEVQGSKGAFPQNVAVLA